VPPIVLPSDSRDAGQKKAPHPADEAPSHISICQFTLLVATASSDPELVFAVPFTDPAAVFLALVLGLDLAAVFCCG
jgi:hypothetical protein